MLEKVLKGSPKYYLWLAFLGGIIGIGAITYIFQLQYGLGLTGMSRDVTWGFYIAQFTYLVGIAASAVMLVLPAYFHGYKQFKKIIIFGEFMAIGAVIMCMLFIVVDMGMPQRMLNVMLHPTLNSVMFYDMMVLIGYLCLNAVVGWKTLECERFQVAYPTWVKYLIYTSVVWAFSIHTVTAFLSQGLPGRHYWLTAVLAVRFLASAFCAGPALLLLLLMVVKKIAKFEIGKEAIKTLTLIITYAMCLNVFLFLCEVFTAFYSNIPGHMHPLHYLFAGTEAGLPWVTYWMWIGAIAAIASLVLLIPPSLRNNMQILPWALGLLVLATWIDKGLGLIIGGFAPSPFETWAVYAPTVPELLISLGIFGVGAFIVSILWKIAIDVKKEVGTL